jgi:MFS family permease
LPLSLGAALGHMSALPVFLAATVYWGAGLGTSAAWNTWIETLVPSRVRAHYFSRRTRLSQIALVAGFALGGAILQFAAPRNLVLPAFAVLFFLASMGRILSAFFLARLTEPVPLAPDHRHVSVREWLRRARHGVDGRLLTYLFAVQSVAQFAGPYFTPYMLGPLKLSYARYVALVAAAFVAKALALPLLGRFARQRGAYRLLCLAGVGIVPVAGLWIFSDNYLYLICVQLLAGVTWGAYELAMFLLFFEAIPRRERTSVLTTFNLGHSLATAAGSLLGGLFLYWGQKSPETYLAIFGLSSVARAATLLALARVPAINVPGQSVMTRTLGVSAGDSALEQPILSSMRDDRPA